MRLDLLLRTGCLLMESAADTSRTMRTMKRVASYLGLPLERLHIYIVYNMLMVNLSDSQRSFTKFQRVERHGVNLDTLRQVSHLSCQALREDYPIARYEQELDYISHQKRNYSPWQVAVGGGLACGGFCIQFGCDWMAFFYAALAAILGLRLRMYLNEKGSNAYVNIGIAAFVSTLLAWSCSLLSAYAQSCSWLPQLLVSATPWHPLLACAMFMVQGVPLINFVSDMLSGYTQVGMTRAVNTLMMLLAMAFGIAFAIQVCGIDNFAKDLPMTPHHA